MFADRSDVSAAAVVAATAAAHAQLPQHSTMSSSSSSSSSEVATPAPSEGRTDTDQSRKVAESKSAGVVPESEIHEESELIPPPPMVYHSSDSSTDDTTDSDSVSDDSDDESLSQDDDEKHATDDAAAAAGVLRRRKLFEKQPLLMEGPPVKSAGTVDPSSSSDSGKSLGLLSAMHKQGLKSASILEVFVYDHCDLAVLRNRRAKLQRKSEEGDLAAAKATAAEQSSWQMDSRQRSEVLHRKATRLKRENTLVYKLKLNTFHLKVSGVCTVKGLIDYVISQDSCKKQRRKIFERCGVDASGIAAGSAAKRGRSAKAARSALVHSTEPSDYEMRIVDEDEIAEIAGLLCTSRQWRQRYGQPSMRTLSAVAAADTLADDDHDDDDADDPEFDFDYPAMDEDSALDLKRWKRLALVYNAKGELAQFAAEEASEMRSLQARVRELTYTEFVVYDLLSPFPAADALSSLTRRRKTSASSDGSSTVSGAGVVSSLLRNRCTLGIGKDRMILMSVLHTAEDESDLPDSSSSSKCSKTAMVRSRVAVGKTSAMVTPRTTNANLTPMMIYRFQTSDLKPPQKKQVSKSDSDGKAKKCSEVVAVSAAAGVELMDPGYSRRKALDCWMDACVIERHRWQMRRLLMAERRRSLEPMQKHCSDPTTSSSSGLSTPKLLTPSRSDPSSIALGLGAEDSMRPGRSASVGIGSSIVRRGSQLISKVLSRTSAPFATAAAGSMSASIDDDSIVFDLSMQLPEQLETTAAASSAGAPFALSSSAASSTISSSAAGSTASHGDLTLALAKDAREFLPITIDECKAINVSREDPSVFELVFVLINEDFITAANKGGKSVESKAGGEDSSTATTTTSRTPGVDRLGSGGSSSDEASGRRSLSSTVSVYSSYRSSFSMSVASSKPQSPFGGLTRMGSGSGTDWSRHRRSLSSDWVFRRLSSGMSESSLIFERMDDMAMMCSSTMRPKYRSIQSHGKRVPFLDRYRSAEDYSGGAVGSSSSVVVVGGGSGRQQSSMDMADDDDSESAAEDEESQESLSFMDVGAFKPVSDERLAELMRDQTDGDVKAKSVAKAAEIDRMQQHFKEKMTERKRMKEQRRMRRMAIVDGMYGTHTVKLQAQSVEECALIVQRVSMLISVEELIVQSTAV